jgi:thiol-disulfide isomerase/thioredoxin
VLHQGEGVTGKDIAYMKKPLVLLSVLMIGIFLVLVLRSRPVYRPPQAENDMIGQPAPDFELAAMDGTNLSLADLKGKVVVLDFWATWCGPCRMTMPEMEKLQKQHPDDFVLLAVNLGESMELVASYVEQQRLEARVLLDLDKRVGSAYGTSSIPVQFVIDKGGILRHTQVGSYPGWIDDLWAQIEKLK